MQITLLFAALFAVLGYREGPGWLRGYRRFRRYNALCAERRQRRIDRERLENPMWKLIDNLWWGPTSVASTMRAAQQQAQLDKLYEAGDLQQEQLTKVIKHYEAASYGNASTQTKKTRPA